MLDVSAVTRHGAVLAAYLLKIRSLMSPNWPKLAT